MPPTSWGTMVILAGNMSWFCFQLLLPPRRREHVLLNFFFDDLYCCTSKFVLAGPFFPALMQSVFRIRGGYQRASCATYCWDACTFHHKRLSTDEARSWTMQRHWDDLKRVPQQELTLSFFILCVVWLDYSLLHHISFAAQPWPA